MDLNPFSPLFSLGEKVFDRIFPDPVEAEKAKLAMRQLEQSGELAELAGQLDINKVEAGSASMFVAGWRPFVGWVCGASLALAYMPKALFLSCFWGFQAYTAIKAGKMELPIFPDLGVTDLLGLLGAMLGIGGLRTFEKVREVATNNLLKADKK